MIPSTAGSSGTYRPLTLSAGGNDTKAHWNITTKLDIRPRSDNNLINTPPSASIMSPYGIPYNIPTEIVIQTTDVDNDNVRCRWSNSSLECGSVCFSRTIPSTTILSTDCKLTITGLKPFDWYCASIQIEDFYNSNSTISLSSIPVQFLIYVYQPKNCSIPTLTSSSSSCIGVQVGVPYTFTFTAINYCGLSSNISSIVVQLISGLVTNSLVQISQTSNLSVYQMNVTYTASMSQIGSQSICASGVDK